MSKKDNNVVNLREAWQGAEQRAHDREMMKRKLIEDMKELTGEDYYIGKKKKKSSRVKFVQMVQENIEYLRQIKYLTTEEKVFLFDIHPYVGFDSNCIVSDIKKKSPVPLTQKAIAELLGTSKPKVSRVVKSLVTKGIIARAESGIEGNNVRSYSLFLNPNIMISGDKEDVNPTLQAMFHKPMMKIKAMKELPIKLF